MPDSAGAAAGSAFNASVLVVENEPATPATEPAEENEEAADNGVVCE